MVKSIWLRGGQWGGIRWREGGEDRDRGKVHRISDNKSWMVWARMLASISIHCATCICFMIWGLSLTFGLTLFMITVQFEYPKGAKGAGRTFTQQFVSILSLYLCFFLTQSFRLFIVFFSIFFFILGRKWVSNIFNSRPWAWIRWGVFVIVENLIYLISRVDGCCKLV